jgi:hypothetical protein
MPPETMPVQATLVLVGAEEIHAKQGDKLMIVAGICVGVMTGKRHAQPLRQIEHTPETKRTEPATPPPPAEKAPERPPLPRNSPRHENRAEVRGARVRLAKRILEHIQANPGIDSTGLGDALGFTRSDVNGRHAIYAECKKMLTRGVLRCEQVHPKNSRLGRRYFHNHGNRDNASS